MTRSIVHNHTFLSGYYSHQWSEISSNSQLVDCEQLTSGSGPAGAATAAATAGPKPSGTLAEQTKSAVIVKTGEWSFTIACKLDNSKTISFEF